MANLVKQISGIGLGPMVKRATGVLSDGITCWAVGYDNNTSAVTGDFGDSTNIAKFYIYTSVDQITWTLRATYATDITTAAVGATNPWSATVGPDNNIHLTWRNNAGQIVYMMFTYGAGPTYTATTQRLLYAVVGGETVSRVDIDTIGTGTTPQVAFVAATILKSTGSTVRGYSVISGGTTIVNSYTFANFTGAQGYKPYTDDIAVACAKDAVTSNVGVIMMIFPRVGTNGVNYGVTIATLTINTSTGAVITTPVQSVLPGSTAGSSISKWHLFCSDNAKTFVAAGVYIDKPTPTISAFKMAVSSAAVQTYLLPVVRTSVQRSNANYNYGDVNKGYQFFGAQYTGAGDVWLGIMGTPGFFGFNIDYNGLTAVAITTFAKRIDISGIPAYSGYQSGISGGSQRNFSSSKMGFLTWYGNGGGYRIDYVPFALPDAPAAVSPSAGSITTRSTPDLAASFRSPGIQVQTRQKMRWQTAADSAFTTALQNWYQDDANFLYPDGTQSSNPGAIVARYTVPSFGAMVQGVWYIRAAAIDEFGNTGAWSNPTTFTISHPPVAANGEPSGGKIFVYGTGDVGFTFDFTDAALPADYATAYQIVVENADTGVTLVDTGKIALPLIP